MWSLIVQLLPLILKNLPLLVGIFTALSNSSKKVNIDEKALAKLVEELTTERIAKLLDEQADKLARYSSRETVLEMREASDRINKELDEMEEKMLERAAKRKEEAEDRLSSAASELESRKKEWEERAKERDELLEQIRRQSGQ